VSVSTTGLAACLLLSLLGCRDTDECARAVARLDRIHATRSLPAMTTKQRDRALAECRRGPKTTYDPVLRCALDADTDAAASICIEQFVHDVVTPGSAGSPQPRAVNPLLD
jgi:hypothetical protein